MNEPTLPARPITWASARVTKKGARGCVELIVLLGDNGTHRTGEAAVPTARPLALRVPMGSTPPPTSQPAIDPSGLEGERQSQQGGQR